jgi:hypothetical protein
VRDRERREARVAHLAQQQLREACAALAPPPVVRRGISRGMRAYGRAAHFDAREHSI